MMDWVTPVIGLLGVVLGAGIQEFRIWREKKEKYKDMVFEKRLDAHQGAYYWCMRLLKVIRPHRLMREGGVEVVNKEIWEATEWLNKNALYLDEDSRVKMAGFFHYISETSYKYVDEKERNNINIKEEIRKLIKNMQAVLSSIKRGIGVKYLPELEISDENIDKEKLLEEVVEQTEELIRKKKK